MKKILPFSAILLALLLTFSSCAGCNQKKDEPDAPTTPVETTAEPTEPSKEPATEPSSEEPGVLIDQDFVDKAADMIYEFYKPGKSNTVSADFTLPSMVKYQGVDVEVKWVVEDGTEYAEIGESDYENLINVLVNKSSSGGPFKLKGIVSAGGYTKEIEFDYVLVSQYDLLVAAYALQPGENIENATLTGVISKVNTPFDPSYNNVTVTIIVDGHEDMPIMCYRLKGDGADTIKVNDTITVFGTLTNYNGTIEFTTGCTLVSIDNVGEEVPDDSPVFNSDREIVEAAYKLPGGETLSSTKTYTLTGKVTKVNTPYDPDYKNVTVTIVVDNMTDKPIQCYRMKGADADKVKVTDVIQVTGYLKNYVNQSGKSTIEFDAGCTLDKIVEVGAGEPRINYGTEAQIVDAAYALAGGDSLVGEQTLTGKVTKVNTPYDPQYKNVTVTIVVANKNDKPIQCYRMKGADADKVKQGDTIQVTGILKNYVNQQGKSTIEFDAGCKLDKIVAAGAVINYGTDAQEVDAAYALSGGDSLSGQQTLTGVVTKINTAYDSQYENVTVTIVVDNKTDKPIMCYRMKGADASKVKVTDTIQVTGTLTNYVNPEGKSTIEFGAGCTLDKIVKSGTGPKQVNYGTDQQEVDAAYALAGGESLEGTQTLTGKVTKVNTPYDNSFKNVTVTIVVEGKEDKPIQCFRMKGDAADKVKVGDTIQVTGTLKNYVNSQGKSTIEFDAGCTLDKIVKAGEGGEEPSTDYGTDAEEVDAAYALEPGTALEGKQTLTGKVTKVNTPYSEQYKNVTVTIVVEGKEDKPIQCYRMKGDDADKVKAGDTIQVTGQLKNYVDKNTGKSTIEFDQGCTLDKIVKAGEGGNEPTGEDKVEAKEYTVDELLAAMAQYKGGQVSKVECTVTGVASSSKYDSTHTSYTVWLKSNDGKTELAVQIYSAKLDESIKEDYTATDAMKGKTVTVKGYAKLYGSTYEISYLKTTESPTGEAVSPLILKVEESVISDLDKLNATLAEPSIPTEINEAKDVTLPKKGTKYPEVSIAWTMEPSASDYAKLGDGKVTFTLPETEAATIKLKAKLSIQNSSETKEQEYTVKINPAMSDEDQVKYEAGELDKIISSKEYNSDATLTLNTAGTKYTKVAITWTLDPSNNESAVLKDAEGGKSLELKIPDNELSVKVKAEVKLNDASATKEYTLTLKKLSTKALLDKIKAELLKDGDKLEGEYTLTGVITEFSYYYRSANSGVSFYLDVLDEEGKSLTAQYPEFLPFLCFTVKEGDTATIGYKDKVAVTGKIVNYGGTIEFDKGGAVSKVEQGNPTAAELVDLIKTQAEKGNYGVGYVSLNGLVKTAPDENNTFLMTVIDEDGKSLEFDLTVFKAKYEGTDPLEEGDTVKVTGVEGTYKYNDTITQEFMSGSKVELVKKHELSDDEKLAAEKEALADLKLKDMIITEAGTKVGLRLNGATYSEVLITWEMTVEPETFKDVVFNEAGDELLVNAIPVENDVKVTLKATLKIEGNDTKLTESYTLTIKPMTDKDKMEAVLAELDKEYENKEYFESKTVELPLSSQPFETVNIAWSLNSEDGEYAELTEGYKLAVKIPEDGEKNIRVTATLTMPNSEANAVTKDYTFKLRQPTIAELIGIVEGFTGDETIGPKSFTGIVKQISYYYSTKNGTTFYLEVLDESGNSLKKTVLCDYVKQEDADKITVEDKVTVTGELNKKNGSVHFIDGTVKIEEKNSFTYAQLIEAVKAQDKSHHVGYATLYGIVNEITEPYDATKKYLCFTMDILDEDGKLQDLNVTGFQVGGEDAEKLKVGDTVKVTGILGYYDSKKIHEFMAGSEVALVEIEPELSDAYKVDFEKNLLELSKVSFDEAGSFPLPTPVKFKEVNITWDSDKKQYANPVEGDLVITLPEEQNEKFNITATLSLNDVKGVTKPFEITVLKPSAGGEESITVTYDASKKYSATTEITVEDLGNGVTATFSVGKNSQGNAPKYNPNGTAIRFYGSNTLTITVPEGARITSITLGFGNDDNISYMKASPGTYDSATGSWTGSAESVLFENTASGQIRIRTIDVTFIP